MTAAEAGEGRDTQGAIRAAAMTLFAEKGFAGVSMRELAREVGIQPASLYHHVAGKEELLWVLTRSALEELEAAREAAMAAVEGEDPAVRLAAFVRAHVAFHARSSLQARLVNLNLDYLQPERAAQAQAARDAYEDRLAALLAEGRETGAFDVPHLRVTTFAVLQMCTGVSAWFREDGALGVDELAEVYVDLVLRLVAARPIAQPPDLSTAQTSG